MARRFTGYFQTSQQHPHQPVGAATLENHTVPISQSEHHTPCRRYLCRAILSAAQGYSAPLPYNALPLCQLLLPPQPALQHRPTAGAHTARVVRRGRGEQEVPPLRWRESEEGGYRAGPRRVRRGQRGGRRGGHGRHTVWAAGDVGHRAGRVRWGQVLAPAVGHGGQRGQGGCRGCGRAPTSHRQGDPLRRDGVDLG